MKRKTRTWKVNRRTGVEARRTGFWLIPDFGSTAHMIQGATLEAAFVDLQDPTVTTGITSQIAAYVCLSRVKKMKSVCVMQPFSPFLFRHGNPAGPDRLLRKIRGEISAKQAFEEWATCSNEEVAYSHLLTFAPTSLVRPEDWRAASLMASHAPSLARSPPM